MKKDELTESQAKAVIKALDEALEKGPWEESNFLRVIAKNLKEIRDSLSEHIEKQEAMAPSNYQSTIRSLSIDQQEIYIALYSAEGNQLQSWDRIIANLQRQIISRPIYAQEEHIQYLIKSKENKLNEAYVAIIINKVDVLAMSPDKIPLDKFGKPLMTLRDRALNLDNITKFVHLSGTYRYVKGHLVKDEPWKL